MCCVIFFLIGHGVVAYLIVCASLYFKSFITKELISI